MRISIGLACAMLTLLLAAESLGLIPDTERAILQGRKSLCESLALQCCLAVEHKDEGTLHAVITSLVRRNQDVLEAGVRRADGRRVADVTASPRPSAAVLRRARTVHVPIYIGTRRWGDFEVAFAPLAESSWLAWLQHPGLRLMVFLTSAGLLINIVYLKRTLKHLDPSSVIPERVRATLDTLSEGVLILDNEERVVLANQSFANHTQQSASELQGKPASEFSWSYSGNSASVSPPWVRAMADGASRTGELVGMQSETMGERTFVVNSTPILDHAGRRRGVLSTFDDVTSIEEKNAQLENMLHVLKNSRDEVNRKNTELTILATRDPLTSCLNRRAFFEQFETAWRSAGEHASVLCCMMVDVDHFKRVNDEHGHAVGDKVLQSVAHALQAGVDASCTVGRYGGEEFCILLPGLDLDQARLVAERLRQVLESRPCANLSITASFGVASNRHGAREMHEMLEQADKSLYASKRNGRNCVTCFPDIPPEVLAEQADSQSSKARRQERRPGTESVEHDMPIPYHAVVALSCALFYRDALTGEHSRRVADLCVITAQGLLSQRDCYVLEMAALLHDIGKLGVPDAILLKPGPLTPEEWRIMGLHDRIGVEIISAAFSSEPLTRIVRTHHAWYGGNPRDASLPARDAIPLGARILAIADAYDAMVSDRVYRAGRSREMAFEELRRCSPMQFDPELVEHFIEALSSSNVSREVTPAVNKPTALRIGLQIERIAEALDSKDYASLAAMAGRLAKTAELDDVARIAEIAKQLEAAASQEPDLEAIITQTNELLRLCRATQTAYLTSVSSDEQAPTDTQDRPLVVAS